MNDEQQHAPGVTLAEMIPEIRDAWGGLLLENAALRAEVRKLRAALAGAQAPAKGAAKGAAS